MPADAAEAVRWYRLAAEQGYAAAQSNLGVMYDNGEAVRWYRLAAEQGYAAAQFNLGVMYANGEGVPEDDAEAVRWYRLAAEQGDATAQSNLGLMYATGEGVPKDAAEAVRWVPPCRRAGLRRRAAQPRGHVRHRPGCARGRRNRVRLAQHRCRAGPVER